MIAKEAKFRKQVRMHYRIHQRDLPWRRTRDPYRILVSECMLQQTQVARVLKFYPRFLKQFPSLRVLARAPLPKVLRAWQGLGYNRRALNLKRATEIIFRQYHGEIPRDEKQLRALPGVGQSTAGAIMAFAFGKPAIFIETNIRRAYIHFFFPKKQKVCDEDILKLITKTLDHKNPREWYWALMDYGAMLGTRETNPNTKSAHYRKQPAFRGSTRELRGKILKLLLTTKRIDTSTLAVRLDAEESRVAQALGGLTRDELVRLRGTMLSL